MRLMQAIRTLHGLNTRQSFEGEHCSSVNRIFVIPLRKGYGRNTATKRRVLYGVGCRLMRSCRFWAWTVRIWPKRDRLRRLFYRLCECVDGWFLFTCCVLTMAHVGGNTVRAVHRYLSDMCTRFPPPSFNECYFLPLNPVEQRTHFHSRSVKRTWKE